MPSQLERFALIFPDRLLLSAEEGNIASIVPRSPTTAANAEQNHADVALATTCDATAEADGKAEAPAPAVVNRYVLLRALGEGASGTAVSARHLASGSLRCIKFMEMNENDTTAEMRAAIEVECLHNCDSFAIMKYYEHFDCLDNGNRITAVVTEFGTAGDLRQEVKRRAVGRAPFLEHESGLIFVQVLLALDHVHSRGMIHRDVKSANVFLLTCGLVKLGDFGFSKMYTDSISDNVGVSFCGTPHMFPPEMWHRRRYSKKIDIWSLGVLLYELLTLNRPFDGTNMNELKHKVLNDPPPPLPDNFCSEMKELVAKLLSKAPEDRPSTAQILQLPIVKMLLSALLDIALRLPDVSDSERQTIVAEIRKKQQAISSKTSTTSCNGGSEKVAFPHDDVARVLHDGPVEKESADRTWKRRYMLLWVLNGKYILTMCANVSCIAVEPDPDFPPAGRRCVGPLPGNSSSISLIGTHELEDIFPVPSKFAKGLTNVFALLSDRGRRLLFRCSEASDTTAWIQALQSAME